MRISGDGWGELMLGLAEAADLPGLAARIVPTLAGALGTSLAIVHREHANGGEGGPSRDWGIVVGAYRPYVATCPLQRIKRRMTSPVAVITDLVDAPMRRSSPVFDDCFARLDADHQLVVNVGHVAPGAPGSTVMILARSRHQRAFSDADLSIVRPLVPPIAAAIARNDRSAALHAAADRTGPPQVAFDETGRVLWMSPAAELVLREVPAELVHAARRLACSVAAPLAARVGPERRTALLRRTTTATGAPLVIATLDMGQPLSPADASARYGLTRGESAVLAVLVRGASNTEIASQLGITAGTVRIHLSRIYGKLGVTSRAQAIVKVRAP